VTYSKLSLLKRSYDQAALQEHRISLIHRFVYRSASFYLTLPFIWLRYSANEVTLLRAPVAMFATLFIATGARSLVLTGSLLYALVTILDDVDGNLARMNGQANTLGELLDAVVHILERTLLPISVAVGLCLRPDRLTSAYPVQAAVILSIGFLISGISFARTALSVLVLSLLQIGSPPATGDADVGDTKTGPKPSRAFGKRASVSSLQKAKRLIRRILTEGGFFLDGIGIIAFAAIDLMSIFLLAISIQNAFRFRDEYSVLLKIIHSPRRVVT
jgi:CDP-alcohol phosphatidyltransferase